MTILVTALTVVVALVALAVVALLRSHADIIDRLGGFDTDAAPARPAALADPDQATGLGAAAHDLVGTTLARETVKVSVMNVPEPTLLAFLSSGCLVCEGFWDAFAADPGMAMPGGARLIVVTKDPELESVRKLSALAHDRLTVIMSSQAWLDYDVPGIPFFAYVDGPSGRVVGQGAAEAWDHVVSLLTDALFDAGLGDQAAPRRRRRPTALAHPEDRASRIVRADQELAAAGIGPGHPSLYPGQEPPAAEGKDAAP